MSKKRKQPLPIFPWDSDSDASEVVSWKEARTQPSPDNVQEQPTQSSLASDGIQYDLIPEQTFTGKVLAHCLACIRKLREATGGECLAIYKIGITHNCEDRFQLYQANGWTKMLVLFESRDLGLIEMLEGALISHHIGRVQCRNILPGGEGMRDRLFNAKFQPPFYCYCTAARADLPRWVR